MVNSKDMIKYTAESKSKMVAKYMSRPNYLDGIREIDTSPRIVN